MLIFAPENIEEVPSFQLIVQQHSVMIDHLASGAAGNNLVLREKLDAVEARPLTNTVTKTGNAKICFNF